MTPTPEQLAMARRIAADTWGLTGPTCRVTSGVCGLPLSAKIVLSLILVWPAWRCVDFGLDYMDGRGNRDRDRLRSVGWLALSAFLFGIIFATWLWGGTS